MHHHTQVLTTFCSSFLGDFQSEDFLFAILPQMQILFNSIFVLSSYVYPLQELHSSQVLVAHACNPSYSGNKRSGGSRFKARLDK
jgi:hypothetical protein